MIALPVLVFGFLLLLHKTQITEQRNILNISSGECESFNIESRFLFLALHSPMALSEVRVGSEVTVAAAPADLGKAGNPPKG